MYGFWGVGQLEVRFRRVLPWRDNRTTEQPNNRTTEQLNNPTRKDRATQPMDY